MHGQGTITMSVRELDRLKVIQAVADGHLARWRAAERLGISARHIRRLVLRLQEDGPGGLTSRKRGHDSNRQLPPGLESRVRGLIRDSYADFGPTLACEKLRERHGIDLAKETVRRIMIDAGFWVPRKLRPPKVHQPRNRRACLGELVQIDGSDHRWFEDRAPACTLLVYVDDATGRLMQLLFVPTESTQAYFTATQAYVERHGKPQAFYSDKAGVFRVNARENAEGRGYTQFGRALFELNIDILCANTSQAKGRVERMNGTLQDRLVKELRLRGISSMAAANAFALTFVADFNARFAKLPRSDFDAHRPLRGDEELARIFCWREWRKVSASLTLQYAKVMYLLADRPEHRRLIHCYIEVAEYPDGRIELWADGTSLPYTTYDRLAQVDQGAIVEHKRLGHVLAIAAQVQAQRDDRRQVGPSRTLLGEPPRPAQVSSNVKRQRRINRLDLERAMAEVGPCQSNCVPATSTTALPIPPRKHRTEHKVHDRADI
ncbi:ISNCY family transposase [Ralstonia pseudosolanacearum]|uniref:ISNCY family transposase n=1 Tax=Ralstonia solanacearum TaxID=305 RepID=A0AA92K1J5_RALSL|nr:ISNCY family transposase [Ralstonia pseudosolanacearum]QOK91805.1 ISNCY family transposase [Ralstonia pseudosolanacearum]QOK96727.1 ISNCY family transposase [Ralstonia pseudosolanacearum]UWD89481.1 ISNCY family transposase [Ralstonia pseudosolanacearum]CAH0442820.1 ISNCY family transposase ISBcen27 [Ralstonia pseudosolanacearum]